MKICLQLLTFFSLILPIIACTKPPVIVDRVLVYNATVSKIKDVRVRHEPTNNVASVNAILPEKSLDVGFAQQPMLAKRATLSWRETGGTERTVTVNLPYNRIMADAKLPMTLVYFIYPSGRIDVHLRKAQMNQ